MKLSHILSGVTVAAVCLAVPFAAAQGSGRDAMAISPVSDAWSDEAAGAKRVLGRDRARIPGGSGCDDPHDIIEHPECRGGAGIVSGDRARDHDDREDHDDHGTREDRGHHGQRDHRDDDDDDDGGRSRVRIPGGSGCDDPGDRAEHAACMG